MALARCVKTVSSELSTFPALVQVQNPTWVQSHLLETSNRSLTKPPQMCYICVLVISWRISGASRGDSRRSHSIFSYASNHDIPWISTRRYRRWSSKVSTRRWLGRPVDCNLMGPENLTLLETTAILSQVLDLPRICASDDWIDTATPWLDGSDIWCSKREESVPCPWS